MVPFQILYRQKAAERLIYSNGSGFSLMAGLFVIINAGPLAQSLTGRVSRPPAGAPAPFTPPGISSRKRKSFAAAAPRVGSPTPKKAAPLQAPPLEVAIETGYFTVTIAALLFSPFTVTTSG